MQDTATEPKAAEAPDQRLRLPELIEYRRAAAKRRAEAFCDVPEYVLGTEVRPLTPATFSMLFAVGSHFIHGGHATEGDVRNYIWFHSPIWAHCGVKDWRKRKARALRSLDFELNQPWRKWIGQKPDLERYMATLALAMVEISTLVNEAFADCPVASGSVGAPLATMEAHLIHQFAQAYRWEPERTRNTPLRQLFQLSRCIRVSNGGDVQDHGEQQILVAHLNRRLAAIRAQQTTEAANG